MINDFICWFLSPKKIKVNVEVNGPLTIHPKQFSKLTIKEELSFYELDKFVLSKKIVNDNWVTLRAVYFDGSDLEIFLFNEGEYKFSVEGSKVIGEVFLEKMNFADWLEQNERN
jgi:hypothetical protein